MPNRHSTLTSLFSDIADAIRAKTGSAASIVADDFDTAIAAIPTGGGSSDNYFWFRNDEAEDGSIIITLYGSNWTEFPDLKYSNDKINWTNIVLNSTTNTQFTFTIPSGTKVYIKNNSNLLSLNSSTDYVNINVDKYCSIGGSISSLVNDTDGNYIYPNCYHSLFSPTIYSSGGIQYADELELPLATAEGCYDHMFSNVGTLVTAPILPAKYVANNAYYYMFGYCNSLTSAPALPAKNLGGSCYFGMFFGCTSLTTAPVLPATNIPNSAYASMFKSCTSLTTAPVLPATTLSTGSTSCYNNMFAGCTSLIEPPALPATIISANCYNNMFKDCTSLVKVPALPATTLALSCYANMFSGCTSLKVYSASDTGHDKAWNIPNSGTITGTTRAQSNMFSDVITDNVPANFPGTTNTQFTYYTEYAPIE